MPVNQYVGVVMGGPAVSVAVPSIGSGSGQVNVLIVSSPTTWVRVSVCLEVVPSASLQAGSTV